VEERRRAGGAAALLRRVRWGNLGRLACLAAAVGLVLPRGDGVAFDGIGWPEVAIRVRGEPRPTADRAVKVKERPRARRPRPPVREPAAPRRAPAPADAPSQPPPTQPPPAPAPPAPPASAEFTPDPGL
jgi:hypothetical protein